MLAQALHRLLDLLVPAEEERLLRLAEGRHAGVGAVGRGQHLADVEEAVVGRAAEEDRDGPLRDCRPR